MNSNKKTIILIMILVGIILIIFTASMLINKNDNAIEVEELIKKQEDGSTINISKKLNENKEINGFIISNINFTEKNGDSELLAIVKNETGKTQNGFLIDIVLYDKTEKEIGRIPGTITKTEPGEEIQIRAKITENYINAYDLKIEKKN